MLTSTPAHHAPRLSLPRRLIGTVVAPRATLERVVALPQWMDVLVVSTLVISGSTGVLLLTDVGQQAFVDERVASVEAFGGRVTDADYLAWQASRGSAWWHVGLAIVVGVPLLVIVLARVVTLAFAAGGERAPRRAVLGIVAHASVIGALQSLVAMPLHFVRESLSGVTNLAALVPLFAEGSAGAVLLGTIDLFVIWQLAVLALGLSIAYERPLLPVLASTLGLYGALALSLAALKSTLGGA